MKIFIITGVYSIVMLLAIGCSVIFREKIVLENNTDNLLIGVKIFATDIVIWEGGLQSGRRVNTSFRPDKDGSIFVSYRTQTSPSIKSPLMGYVTPNGSSTHIISVTDEGFKYELK